MDFQQGAEQKGRVPCSTLADYGAGVIRIEGFLLAAEQPLAEGRVRSSFSAQLGWPFQDETFAVDPVTLRLASALICSEAGSLELRAGRRSCIFIFSLLNEPPPLRVWPANEATSQALTAPVYACPRSIPLSRPAVGGAH